MLVATGRTPKIDALDLAAGGIELDPTTAGPRVDRELRTTSPHAWAIGDALGRQLYTHVANHEGPYAAKNALQRLAPAPRLLRRGAGRGLLRSRARHGRAALGRGGRARLRRRHGHLPDDAQRQGARDEQGGRLHPHGGRAPHAQDPRRDARLPRRGERAAGDPRRDGRRRHDRRRSARRSTRTRRSSRPSTHVRARSSRSCRLAARASQEAARGRRNPGVHGAAHRLSRPSEG